MEVVHVRFQCQGMGGCSGTSRDGFRVESSRVRVEHRTGLSCSKLEIFEFDRAHPFARFELEIFDRAKVLMGLDLVRVRSSRGSVRLELEMLDSKTLFHSK
jgi:hypothetical protein